MIRSNDYEDHTVETVSLAFQSLARDPVALAEFLKECEYRGLTIAVPTELAQLANSVANGINAIGTGPMPGVPFPTKGPRGRP